MGRGLASARAGTLLGRIKLRDGPQSASNKGTVPRGLML